MTSLDPQPYTVLSGETLTTIATRAGFQDWRDIYQNPANAALRALRPNPSQIRVGDRVMIPPKPAVVRQVMQQRLMNLMSLRRETDSLYRQIESDMEANIRRYENVANLADAAATVAGVFAGLGKLVYQGMGAMRLSGAALATANRELAKESLKFAVDPLKDPMLHLAAERIGANDGIVFLLGKTAIESFLNIQSPSWWAAVIGNLKDGKSWTEAVTAKPVEALRAARDAVDRQRQDTLRAIDQKIGDAQFYLGEVSRGSLLSLYDPGLRRFGNIA